MKIILHTKVENTRVANKHYFYIYSYCPLKVSFYRNLHRFSTICVGYVYFPFGLSLRANPFLLSQYKSKQFIIPYKGALLYRGEIESPSTAALPQIKFAK